MLEADTSFNAYACDLWAAGVCYYVFLVGKLPFYSEAISELFEQIEAAAPPYDALSGDAARVCKGLLTKDVDARLTVQDLEQDEWLLGVAEKRAAPRRRPRLSRVDVSERDISEAFSPVHAKHGGFSSFVRGFKARAAGAAHAVERAAHRASTVISHSRPGSGTGMKPG
eukprot:CAMPEP_0119260300 /NCGR_PEP_ID=MMETSP1329-20130426/754_1 /TAXON_ID=114041 /ORGANISM="Genus nov. species nov., Strain RCC1024" /LENGTH=168 /DNA_ID=CAMNT_0007259723 /DNA_START=1 /DNA_END=503 /DNA_ORIENTATION=-